MELNLLVAFFFFITIIIEGGVSIRAFLLAVGRNTVSDVSRDLLSDGKAKESESPDFSSSDEVPGHSGQGTTVVVGDVDDEGGSAGTLIEDCCWHSENP